MLRPMKIVENSADRLVVRDRSHLAALAVMVIALIFGVLGFGGMSVADTAAERIAAHVFGYGSFAIALGALFIIRTHTHVFDRGAGLLHRRVAGLFGRPEQQQVPLGHVRRAEVDTDSDSDGDTHRVVLILAEGGGERVLPMRNYHSSTPQQAMADSINAWLRR
ncbi:MAG: hypothetical protein AAF074_23610 [Pseudomonadota bacterium]